MKFKKKGLMNEERGSFAYFIAFVFLALTLVFLFGVGIPLLVSINTEFYAAGEDIINMSANTTSQIQDANARAVFEDAQNAMLNSTEDQVEILSTFYQYGWLLIIVIIVLILFMASRQQVESGGGVR
jgi:hypothetical protein